MNGSDMSLEMFWSLEYFAATVCIACKHASTTARNIWDTTTSRTRCFLGLCVCLEIIVIISTWFLILLASIIIFYKKRRGDGRHWTRLVVFVHDGSWSGSRRRTQVTDRESWVLWRNNWAVAMMIKNIGILTKVLMMGIIVLDGLMVGRSMIHQHVGMGLLRMMIHASLMLIYGLGLQVNIDRINKVGNGCRAYNRRRIWRCFLLRVVIAIIRGRWVCNSWKVALIRVWEHARVTESSLVRGLLVLLLLLLDELTIVIRVTILMVLVLLLLLVLVLLLLLRNGIGVYKSHVLPVMRQWVLVWLLHAGRRHLEGTRDERTEWIEMRREKEKRNEEPNSEAFYVTISDFKGQPTKREY